jgi:DNA-binding transcriptional LysR family regulator
MWETVELREVRVFLALAQELHFGRAAERLGVTQSRVSQSLRELEHKLGERLVHRTSRRVALTAAGERFLAEVEPAHQRLSAVLERASRHADEIAGGLRIGLLTAVSAGPRLIELIKAFEARHPGCNVEVKELALSDRFEPLRQGDVELMVARLPLEEQDLVAGPIVSHELRVLAVAADHPLSDRSEVTTEDIADYEVVDLTGLVPPDLADVLIPATAASGRPMKRRRLKHHDWSELTTMIARGKIVHPIVASVADQFDRPGIRCVPISDLPVWTSALVWRRGDSGRRLRAFAEVAEELLGDARPPRGA